MVKQCKNVVVPILLLVCILGTRLTAVKADFVNITDNLSVNMCGVEDVYRYRDYLNNVAFYSKEDFKYLEDSWSYTGTGWYENVLNMFSNNEIKQYIKNKPYNKSLWDLAQEETSKNEDSKDLDSDSKNITKNTKTKNKHEDISSDDIVIVY